MNCAEQIEKFLLFLASFHLWITTLEKRLIIPKKTQVFFQQYFQE